MVVSNLKIYLQTTTLCDIIFISNKFGESIHSGKGIWVCCQYPQFRVYSKFS